MVRFPIGSSVCVWRPKNPATRKHELNLDTDRVLCARGLLPHDWSLARELSEKSGCEKATRWLDSLSVPLCALRPKNPGHQETRILGIQTVFCSPVGCCHTIGHLRANFPRSQDVRKPPNGSIPYRFLCVRCDQRALATRKHEFWDTDRVLFARGLLPHDWSLASELSEKSGCEKATKWFDSLSVPLCALRPKSPGHQETRILGYRPCFVRPWVAATRLVTCERTFREVRM